MTAKNTYHSVNLTRLFMKLVGFWYVESRKEQALLWVLLTYAVCAIVFAIVVEVVDLYHCVGDFYAVTYNLCATLLLIMILVKFSTFLARRKLILRLIRHAEDNFWGVQYDNVGSEILKDYDAKGIMMVYTFTVIVLMATGNYVVAPIFENMKRNGSDRVLPFKLWVDLPLTVSPWYEITYTIQSLSTIHSGICTFCFDNFISTFNLHSAAQMKILAHRIEIITEKFVACAANEKSSVEIASETAYGEMKDCVERHYLMIDYLEKLDSAFTVILFGQLLLSSVVICFGGFQFLVAENVIRKCIFTLHFVGSLSQLFIYTWTCNDIIVQSAGISDAAYNAKWYLVPQTGTGKALKKGMMMIMMRARRPCSLTAGHFTVMSLETFTGVLSSSMSYFTLLRQMSEE